MYLRITYHLSCFQVNDLQSDIIRLLLLNTVRIRKLCHEFAHLLPPERITNGFTVQASAKCNQSVEKLEVTNFLNDFFIGRKTFYALSRI